ncbi:MAG TPA: O-methyltransferase [Kineosporiaceae bacterium]|nr:O-methyltransferase [Kineosporiaceae bacterium]
MSEQADPTPELVDAYLTDLLSPDDEGLAAAQRDADAAGLPAIAVSGPQGKLLSILARAIGARRILEIGTLGGYSTIWLARALAPGGRLISLEYSPRHAEVARANLARARLSDVVDVRVGKALETLPMLAAAQADPFDLVFVDADKAPYAQYLDWAIRLTRPGALIVVDNVVRGGRILHPDPDADAAGVRAFLERMAADPRVDGTALQTVGVKGWDGLAVAVRV